MEEQRTHISQGKAEAFLVCDRSLGTAMHPSFHGFVVRIYICLLQLELWVLLGACEHYP